MLLMVSNNRDNGFWREITKVSHFPAHLHTHAVRAQSLDHVQLLVTPWTVAYQSPLTVGFFRQDCWSGLPFPPPGNLPDPECLLYCRQIL